MSYLMKLYTAILPEDPTRVGEAMPMSPEDIRDYAYNIQRQGNMTVDWLDDFLVQMFYLGKRSVHEPHITLTPKA